MRIELQARPEAEAMAKAAAELEAAHCEMARAIARRLLAIDVFNRAAADLWKATGSEQIPPQSNFGGLGPVECGPTAAQALGEDGLYPVDRLGRVHVPRAKVGPATGQPRTEAPLAADGSGTVVNLGEAFREAMRVASRDSLNTEQHRLHHLHTAVAELARVVERMGAKP